MNSTERCFVKKVLFEILQNSQKSTCARISFLIKLQASGLNISVENTFFILLTIKIFLEEVSCCFNSWKNSCFICRSTSYFEIKISLSQSRATCLELIMWAYFFLFSRLVFRRYFYFRGNLGNAKEQPEWFIHLFIY